MAFCPVCKAELKEGATDCYLCGQELDETNGSEWVILGDIEDKLSVDYAKETLSSYNIPVVIFSKSGFFGDVGLPLNPFYKPSSAMYEVSVPEKFVEEAVDILNMILSDKWQKKES